MPLSRRQSLRPRQIDIHCKMRVVESENQLMVDDEGGNSISSLDQFNALANDLQPSKPKKKKNIPIPIIGTVKNYEKEVPPDYEIPTSYVRYQALPPLSEDVSVDIDLEVEDMEWLTNHPKYGENGDPRYQLPVETFERMLDALEKASGMIAPNLIALGEAEEIFRKKLGLVKTPHNKCTIAVFNYWVQKRQKLKRPILRAFWPQTPLNDTNPHLVFRPREKERYKLRKHRRNDMEGYQKMYQLRQDFEKVRNMLKLVAKRERYKRMQVEFMDEIRRQTLYDIFDTSGQPRIPKIPIEEGKKKKKKKARKESIDKHNESTKARPPGFDVTVPLKIPSFMEYDTSENFQNVLIKEPTLSFYPLESSLFLVNAFVSTPKYRCRGRLGRGGRLIIDREIVAPSSKHLERSEVFAHPSLFDQYPSKEIKVVEKEVEGVKKPFLTAKRLEEIGAMSDSEDEILEPTTSSQFINIRKSTAFEHTRKVKYAIDFKV